MDSIPRLTLDLRTELGYFRKSFVPPYQGRGHMWVGGESFAIWMSGTSVDRSPIFTFSIRVMVLKKVDIASIHGHSQLFQAQALRDVGAIVSGPLDGDGYDLACISIAMTGNTDSTIPVHRDDLRTPKTFTIFHRPHAANQKLHVLVDCEVQAEGLGPWPIASEEQNAMGEPLVLVDFTAVEELEPVRPPPINDLGELNLAAFPESEAQSTDIGRECIICNVTVCCCDVMRTLPCAHRFHSECLRSWLTFNPICPVDRSQAFS